MLTSARCAGGVHVEVEVLRERLGQHVARRAGDHRRVVGAELARRDVDRDPEPGQPFAQGAVGGHPAPHRELLGPGLRQRAFHAQRQRLDDRPLVGGGEIGAAALCLGLAQLAHAVQQRGLQPGEGEVEPGHPRAGGEGEGLRVAVAGQPLQGRPAGIAQPQQARALVEGLARRRRRASGPAPRSRDRGRSPGPGRCGRRWRRGSRNGGSSGAGARKPAAMWPCRWSTGASGSARAAAIALAVASPTSSAPTRPGPRVTATRSMSASSACGLAQRVVDGGADELEVVAAGDLGDDAAVAVVDALRGDDVGHGSGRRP